MNDTEEKIITVRISTDSSVYLDKIILAARKYYDESSDQNYGVIELIAEEVGISPMKVRQVLREVCENHKKDGV